MSRAGPFASMIGRAAAAVRRHFADPTFYARQYRASVEVRKASPARGQSAAEDHLFRFMTWWLPRPRRGGAQSQTPPDVFEQWVARPAVFLSAMPVGLAIIVATLGVAPGATLTQGSAVGLGLLAAWLGLTGGMAYAERRSPRTEPVLIAGVVLLSVAAILWGMHLTGRSAVGAPLVQIGLWTLVSLAVNWWRSRPGKDES